MNSKLALIFVFFFLTSFQAWSQEEGDTVEQVEEAEGVEFEPERAPWRDRIFFGGGGGLQFSNWATFVSVMPSVGYRITPKLSGGVTGIYQYTYLRDFQVSTHNYGASLFSRYFVFPQIFAAAEYEQINFDIVTPDLNRSRRWVDRMLVGAGYFQQGSGRGGFHIGVLYDLFFTRSMNYPYQSPFVYRVGFIF